MLFINFKNYKSGLGKAGVELVSKAHSSATKYKSNIVLGLNPTIVSESSIYQNEFCKISSQHFDPTTQEKSTGYLTLESFSSCEVFTHLLNHAEHKIDLIQLKQSIEVFLTDLSTQKLIVCFANQEELINILSFLNNLNYSNKEIYLAYEPPALIGNSYSANPVSVLEAERSNILSFKELIHSQNLKFLIGAGVKQESDFETCYQVLGLDGILLSSVIMESRYINSKLDEIISFEARYHS